MIQGLFGPRIVRDFELAPYREQAFDHAVNVITDRLRQTHGQDTRVQKVHFTRLGTDMSYMDFKVTAKTSKGELQTSGSVNPDTNRVWFQRGAHM